MRNLPGLWVSVIWILAIGGPTFWWAYGIASGDTYPATVLLAVAFPSLLLFVPRWLATHSFAYRAGIARSYGYGRSPGLVGLFQKQGAVATEVKPGFILAVWVEAGITLVAYSLG